MRTIIVRRKLCTRVFPDDVAVSSSPSGGTSRVVSASPRVLCSYARVRTHPHDRRDSHPIRGRFIVHTAMCATLDIRGEASTQSDAIVESHWHSRSGIKVTKLEEPRARVLFPLLCLFTIHGVYGTRMTHVCFTRVPCTVPRHAEISLDIIRNFHKIFLPNLSSRDASRNTFIVILKNGR